MAKILCAIRGGDASLRLQDIAINLAKESGDELVFLYVVNIEFVESASIAMRESVSAEMEKLGKFLLLMALERANKQGVTASQLIRHGNLQEEFEIAASAPDISKVLFGKPGDGAFFSLESLESLATEIAERCQVEVMIR
jgi:nucleotide-binding universal stress UspA family protein